MQLSCKTKQFVLPMKCCVRITITSNQNCTAIPVSDLNSHVRLKGCNVIYLNFSFRMSEFSAWNMKQGRSWVS